MTDLLSQLKDQVLLTIKEIYSAEVPVSTIQLTPTRKEFSGDYSLVTFPLTRFSGQSPELTAEQIGQHLAANSGIIESFNVIKGFLNLVLKDKLLIDLLHSWHKGEIPLAGRVPAKNIVVEYCGPNTNKPLHLGHMRNIILGYSVSSILSAVGHKVHPVNIYNDRGIAICKSMVAWIHAGKKDTPESTGKKGDHLVGQFYVVFDRMLRKEVEELMAAGMDNKTAEKSAPMMKEAQDLLLKWESGDEETISIWKTMNSWVYRGFQETYQLLGIWFEKEYYESQTYLAGKKIIDEGLSNGQFFRKPDGSVWVDLTGAGLDEKVLLRSDGTSVYLTQDLGTAEARYQEFHMDLSVYVVADEQNYHFKALKATLEKLERGYALGIYHLSYGMVDLPEGKMKSREGTTVDADDLIQSMTDTARDHTRELGKTEGFTDEDAEKLYKILGLGALKFYLARVNPRKRMLFNPQESIQFHGDTGPFIQYTFARICSVLRKKETAWEFTKYSGKLKAEERELLLQIEGLPFATGEAATQFDPSHLALHLLNIAKAFNKFYQEHSILNTGDPEAENFRLALSLLTSNALKKGMALLGIELPERM